MATPLHLTRRTLLGAGASLAGSLALPVVGRAAAGPVRIGVLGDYGSGTDLGGPGSVIAAKLAAAEAGEIGGHPVEVIAADHHNKPDVAVNLARQWYDDGGVDAITDLAISSVGLAVAALSTQKQRIALVSGAATSDITGRTCSPFVTHWADDTYALSNGLAHGLLKEGRKKWFFVAVDYSLGESMVRDGSAVVKALGGDVVGSVRFPFNTSDFSSMLLTAQSSGADTIGIASTGQDTINAVKQAVEFGLPQSGKALVGMLTFITDVHAIGLPAATGMMTASQYYWDDDEPSRAFAKRFSAQLGRIPTKLQAATYAGVRHYLKTVKQAGTTDGPTVAAAMRSIPVDFFGRPATLRADGRVTYDLGLYRVKTSSESKGEWDLYARVDTIAAAQAFRPLGQAGCTIT